MKKTVIVLMHLAYWLLYCLLLLFILLAVKANAAASGRITLPLLLHAIFFSVFAAFTIGNAVIGFYSFYLVLFPKFLYRKKLLPLVIYGLLLPVASALIIGILLSAFINPRIMFADGWHSAIAITVGMALLALIHGVIGLVIRGFIAWYGDIKLKEELKAQNYEMELALVKSQINPHFLFNTINNIDMLIEKDAAKASAYLNKLSDIMRFMLYEAKTEKISLAKEIAYIEKYTDLQKIRSANPGYVTYSCKGDAGGIMIEPMIFIPFIENAFKHAEHNKAEHAISISLYIEQHRILFSCENRYTGQPAAKPGHGGLGNMLIKKRLGLLYPGRHELLVSRDHNMYKVKLSISTYEA